MTHSDYYKQVFSRDIPWEAPGGFIQWKGTNVCMDILCICGYEGHIDTDFFYHYACPKCARIYAVGQHVRLIELTAEEREYIIHERGDSIYTDEITPIGRGPGQLVRTVRFCPPLQLEVSIDPLTGVIYAPKALSGTELDILYKWAHEQLDKLAREGASEGEVTMTGQEVADAIAKEFGLQSSDAISVDSTLGPLRCWSCHANLAAVGIRLDPTNVTFIRYVCLDRPKCQERRQALLKKVYATMWAGDQQRLEALAAKVVL